MKTEWLYRNGSGRRVRLLVGGEHAADVDPWATGTIVAGKDERPSVYVVGAEAVGTEAEEPTEEGYV